MSGSSHKSNNQKQPEVVRLYKALIYSLAGLTFAFKNEAAFRTEIVVSCIGTLIALFLPVSFPEKAALIAVLLFVIIIELLNSAIEAVVDRVSVEIHPLAKASKDLGSAAVLFSFILAVIVWAGILIPVLFA